MQVIECPPDKYILTAAGEAGVSLPFDCLLGSCVACGAKLLEGTVDQTEQVFLNEMMIKEGFILSCVAYPTSDCTVETYSADDINAIY